MVERPVAPSWAGRPLTDIEIPGVARAVAVSRMGIAQVATPDLVTQDGDVVYLAVAVGHLDEVDRHLGAGAEVHRVKVVIAGGGAVGTFIAGELQQAGHEVHIIEQDEDRVTRMQAVGRARGRRRGTWPTPARSTACAPSAWPTPTWWPPSPATTRTTWSSACWPSRSSPCPASSPG